MQIAAATQLQSQASYSSTQSGVGGNPKHPPGNQLGSQLGLQLPLQLHTFPPPQLVPSRPPQTRNAPASQSSAIYPAPLSHTQYPQSVSVTQAGAIQAPAQSGSMVIQSAAFVHPAPQAVLVQQSFGQFAVVSPGASHVPSLLQTAAATQTQPSAVFATLTWHLPATVEYPSLCSSHSVDAPQADSQSPLSAPFISPLQ